MTPTAPAAPRQRVADVYLGVTFLSQLGSAAALLAATVVSSNAGSNVSEAALLTALMLAFNYGVSAVATPYAGRVARRFGIGRTFAATQAGGVVVYLALAILMWLGVPGYPALICVTPFLGLFGGIGHVAAPMVSRAYYGEGMAQAQARSSTATGLAWVIGAIGGAWIIDRIGPGSAYFADAVLTLPLIAVLVMLAPNAPFGKVASIKRPWHDMFRQLRSNPRLRRAAGLGLATAVFVAPLVSMVVPLTRSMDHYLALHAGIVIAFISLGEIFAPLVVRRIGRRWGALRSASAAYLGAGVLLMAIAGWVILTERTSEFAGVCAFAMLFGAMHFGGTALLIADASGSAEGAEQQEALSAYFFVLGIGIPLGTILWGQLLGVMPATTLLLLTGGAMLLIVCGLVVHLNRIGAHLPPVVADPPDSPIGSLRHHWH
ncbi:MAG: MFS transporter [Candidatus Nanopelagicales bacterium]